MLTTEVDTLFPDLSLFGMRKHLEIVFQVASTDYIAKSTLRNVSLLVDLIGLNEPVFIVVLTEKNIVPESCVTDPWCLWYV